MMDCAQPRRPADPQSAQTQPVAELGIFVIARHIFVIAADREKLPAPQGRVGSRQPCRALDAASGGPFGRKGVDQDAARDIDHIPLEQSEQPGQEFGFKLDIVIEKEKKLGRGDRSAAISRRRYIRNGCVKPLDSGKTGW